ncbi:hypothetical protein SAMN05444354_103228 [Stigmatella aurantiaca]|uniref:Uncharacterized protein n=1 Tax=Stigmatella aurantiaca TaxID=41 RepID=A0A1H7LHH8_STIAU|nr:hypothetical protein [Stigmatella aurantiaca]SEK97827.1 hypothetical protein SAMN05444354_103228 [Stigmatella aurantiaca]
MTTNTKKAGRAGVRQAVGVLALLGASSVLANTPGLSALASTQAVPVEEIVLVSKSEPRSPGSEPGENCLGDLLGGLLGTLLIGSL